MSSGGKSVNVCARDASCVIAKAMFIVPSVTMNGGSLMRVISSPLIMPTMVVTPIPPAMAIAGCQPCCTANMLMTIDPSAMTIPQARSMPPVRITSVCPMASTPTTIT